MWKAVRITLLLFILAGAAIATWLDRVATQSWHETLWVGIYPLNGDGTEAAERYIASLKPSDFTDIEAFFAREAPRYGVKLAQPVHIELYPEGAKLPPLLPPGSGALGIVWWSLKVRWFAARAAAVPGRAPSHIRLFVLYHDPATLDRVPDSHGLQKGLIGIVYAFADRSLATRNDIVIAHELLHTVGASDKYDLATGAPLFPDGFADPQAQPLYPQSDAEIMAGRRALSAQSFEMPGSLRNVVVGPATALEIRWSHP